MANIMTLDKLRVKEARGDVISWEYKPPRGNIWTLQDIRDRDCFGRVSVRGNSEESYKLMMSVVEKVNIIMRRRRWYISELQELDPGSKYLGLNVGHTLEIHLKLRTWRGFISHNDLVLTMLHELTHIINSSHDDAFYALFYRLKAEYETHYDVKLSTKTRTTQCGNGVGSEEQRRKRVLKWERFFRRLFRIKDNEHP
ncbi:MAG: WLM domain-containing protein [Linnemannia elongata]|nr:MAG: WLM domain-containing protein [Linnemannia elongata]